MTRKTLLLTILTLIALTIIPAIGQRRVTPVNTPATRTQSQNDKEGDSIRALERRRARSTQYTDQATGKVVMIDTISGEEWIDSTLLPKAPPMKYQLLHAINVSANIWDPVMRAFGQKYGGMDAHVNISLHNRYLPTFEVGLGTAKDTPADQNFTYKSSLAPYFKIGCDYNFLYNSNPDYQFFAIARYGFSAFKFSLENCTSNNGYWGETNHFGIPSTSVTAGWFEIGLGLRVKLWGPISAGWALKYHSILHQTHPATGDAWYIPGYGTTGSSLSGAFNITYSIPFRKKNTQVPDTASIPDPRHDPLPQAGQGKSDNAR